MLVLDQKQKNTALLEEYLEHLEITKAWKRNLKSKLTKLISWLSEQELEAVEVRIKTAYAYAQHLGSQNFSKNTVCTLLVAATRFYSWLKKTKRIASNPFAGIYKPKMDKLLPRHLPKQKELDNWLLDFSDWEKEENLLMKLRHYRMHVLCEFLYSTGMRISEAASVKAGDIDFETGTIKVRDSKSRKEKLCFLNTYALQILKLFVERIRKYYMPVDDRLFCASSGRLSILLGMTVKEHKPGFPLTCHSFRHCFGYHMLKSGCGLRHIQTFLGHEKLSSTQIYTKVDTQDLKGILDNCHPRNFIAGEEQVS